MARKTSPSEAPRESGAGIRLPWSRSERPVPRRVLKPLQQFLSTESAGGILLLAAAVLALVWANSPWSGAYERLWGTELRVGLGRWAITEDLRHWVNDALMSIFFFVVGLEIKRELTTGELRDPRAAALPVVGALGGMVVPALLYVAINTGGDGSRGWGIPMATDIAFAVGVLALLGRGIPSSLRLFLLTLAIVDDIGAIVVIAAFYSSGINWEAVLAALGLLATMVVLHRLQVRAIPVFVVLGAGVWLATFESGIHATIAGATLGILAPAYPFQRPRAVSEEARRIADETVDEPDPVDADAHHWLRLAHLSREAVSPIARLESLLHPWTSYVIIPIFALANAGVSFGGGAVEDAVTSRITLGVVIGLVLGKTLGITVAARLAASAGLVRLPAGVGWDHVVGVAALAGIGFTVSLFISNLAFASPVLQDEAKIGILAASVAAGAIGAAILRRRMRQGS